jgi:UDP-N-acetylglucosamine pyrophosphorylase
MTGDPALIKTADGMGNALGYLAPKGFANIKVFS